MPFSIVAAVAVGTIAAAAPKPNFVILFVDDMGIDQIEVPTGQRSCVHYLTLCGSNPIFFGGL